MPVLGLRAEAPGEAVTEQHKSLCKAERADFPSFPSRWLHSDPWALIGISGARAGGASLSQVKPQ